MKTILAAVSAAAIAGFGIAPSFQSNPTPHPQKYQARVGGFAPVVQRNAPPSVPGVTMTVNVAGTGQIDGTYIASPVVPINPDSQQYWVTLASANPNYAWPQGKILVNRTVQHVVGGGVIVTLNAGAWYQLDAYGTILGERDLIGGDPLSGGSCSFTAPWVGFGFNSTATITVSP